MSFPDDLDELLLVSIDDYLTRKGLHEAAALVKAKFPSSASHPIQLEDAVNAYLERQRMLQAIKLPSNETFSHRIPETTVALDNVHATNILSLSHVVLHRNTFDTATADYKPQDIHCIVSTAADRTVKLTNIVTGDLEEIFTPSKSVVLSTHIHQDLQLMACGSMDGSVQVVNLADGQTLFHTKDHIKYCVRVALSADGRWLASASYDKTICLYENDASSGIWRKRQTHRLDSNPEAICFLPDSKHLAFTRREDFHIHYICLSGDAFPVLSFNLNEKLDDHVSFTIMHIEKHPIQKVLSLQTDSTQSQIFVVPFLSNERLATLYTSATHSEWSSPRHSWFPDGSAVACNSEDGFVLVVSPKDGRTIKSTRAHGMSQEDLLKASSREEIRARIQQDKGSSNVKDVKVIQTQDGPLIVSCSYDKTIRMIQCQRLE